MGSAARNRSARSRRSIVLGLRSNGGGSTTGSEPALWFSLLEDDDDDYDEGGRSDDDGRNETPTRTASFLLRRRVNESAGCASARVFACVAKLRNILRSARGRDRPSVPALADRDPSGGSLRGLVGVALSGAKTTTKTTRRTNASNGRANEGACFRSWRVGVELVTFRRRPTACVFVTPTLAKQESVHLSRRPFAARGRRTTTTNEQTNERMVEQRGGTARCKVATTYRQRLGSFERRRARGERAIEVGADVRPNIVAFVRRLPRDQRTDDLGRCARRSWTRTKVRRSCGRARGRDDSLDVKSGSGAGGGNAADVRQRYRWSVGTTDNRRCLFRDVSYHTMLFFVALF